MSCAWPICVECRVALGKRRLLHLLARFGVHETATPAELRKAYFCLAKQTHPDTNSAFSCSSEQFARVTAEFEEADSLLRQALLRDGKGWAQSSSGPVLYDHEMKHRRWKYSSADRTKQEDRHGQSGSWMWAVGGVAVSTFWLAYAAPPSWQEPQPQLPRHAGTLGPGPVLGWSLRVRSLDDSSTLDLLPDNRALHNVDMAAGRPLAPMSESERRQRAFVVSRPKPCERVLKTAASRREHPGTLPAWVLRKSPSRSQSEHGDEIVSLSMHTAEANQSASLPVASPDATVSSGARVRAAAERGLAEWLDVLGEQGAHEFNSADSEGRTALHFSAASGQFRACRVLLKYGARADSVDCGNRTPITVARDAGCPEIVQLLEGATQLRSRENSRLLNKTGDKNAIDFNGRR
eukprot:CAMPEP_0204272342 /NCGR_PEP_ID=MMETSP0468-20130131/22029_1 /ASSEMBLY_ACC=CAM_ASM_000383 /TAXON_ID=2969 /ORGANISM="Oxyrrhis marina" /LENGTH=406 /DNA_ID=CAMNT_0051248173 /DNA_START=36 /DNA_END=1257 /DNA_ORIENTATION=-